MGTEPNNSHDALFRAIMGRGENAVVSCGVSHVGIHGRYLEWVVEQISKK